MTKFANVIIDLSAEALDRMFSYRIPEGMELCPGYQLQVPFGPRKMEGFAMLFIIPPSRGKPRGAFPPP